MQTEFFIEFKVQNLTYEMRLKPRSLFFIIELRRSCAYAWVWIAKTRI